MTRVACIGECMIELKQAQPGQGLGLYSRGFGGDTLNTAVYLARLGVAVDYVTALGDDPLSDEMIAGWQAEGVGTAKVARLPGKLPGLYLIMTDTKGERRFFHWRESAAARSLLDLPESENLLQSLVHLRSRLSLGDHALDLYRKRERAVAGGAAAGAQARHAHRLRHQFPRPRLARSGHRTGVFREAFETSDIALASTEDLLPLYAGESTDGLLAKIPSGEAVLKLAEPVSMRARPKAPHSASKPSR